MSTKIYDAYRLPVGTDPFEVVASLRAAILPARLRADARVLRARPASWLMIIRCMVIGLGCRCAGGMARGSTRRRTRGSQPFMSSLTRRLTSRRRTPSMTPTDSQSRSCVILPTAGCWRRRSSATARRSARRSRRSALRRAWPGSALVAAPAPCCARAAFRAVCERPGWSYSAPGFALPCLQKKAPTPACEVSGPSGGWQAQWPCASRFRISS